MTHTRIHKIWSKLLRADGQAFVEFAIVLPILVLLVFGIAQFGIAFRNYLAITDAARVAARAAAVKRTSSPCAAATTAIQNNVSAASGPRSRAGSPAPPARTSATRSRSRSSTRTRSAFRASARPVI